MGKHDDDRSLAVTRRGFIGTLGAGAMGAAIGAEPVLPVSNVTAVGETGVVTLRINGRAHQLRVEPRWTLLHVLREVLGMTGTKPGCERGECGACTVLVDGRPRYACLMLAMEAEGFEITTIEGLARPDAPSPVVQAFVAEDACQCGFCTPGQVVAAVGLLRRRPQPTPAEIREGMSGNICRCGAYDHICRAVKRAASGRVGEA
jgi:xanthine dehydrogenase YagT iron-sulfur-binding subunit